MRGHPGPVRDKEVCLRLKPILVAFAVSFPLALAPLAAEVTIQRGVDLFSTAADGRTYYDFARNPIPASFFCEGSKAFTGRVALKGLPLVTATPGQLGTADTVIERLDDAVFDAQGAATTRLRFRALSLVSIAPLKTACGDFHVYVSLGGEQRVTRMSIRRTEEGGGTFVAPLAVNARMTFIPVQPTPKAARTLELTGSFTFPALRTPWSLVDGALSRRMATAVVDTNGDQRPDTLIPAPSNFLAGRSPQANKLGSCCSERVCHTDSGKMHCTFVIPDGCMVAERC